MNRRLRTNSLLVFSLFALLGSDGPCEFTKPAPQPTPQPPPPPPPPQPCPSPNAHDVLKDPVVQDALDEAWRRSQEGTPDEHEEAFWVIQRRKVSGKETSYWTQIIWDKPGAEASAGGSNKPRVSGGRLVMRVHTHPGPGGENQDNDIYTNDRASDVDVEVQERTGVPSAIRYGQGPDPANTKTFLVPRPDSGPLLLPTNLNWKCPEPPPPPPKAPPPEAPPTCDECSRGTGDPHITSADGLTFDLQAAGEFVAVAVDETSRLQLRLEPLASSREVSIITAVAMRVGEARVSVRPELGLYVDGEPVMLDPAGRGLFEETGLVMVGASFVKPSPDPYALAGGGTVRRYGADYVVDWPDSSRLWVQVQQRSLDVYFATAEATADRTAGIFGVYNHDPKDDLTTRDGARLAAPDFEPLHRRFAESWRVRPAESLFDYRPGESSATFNDPTMPEAPMTLETLSPERREEAQGRCVKAGIVEPTALAECTLDLALSGDPSFLRSAATAQAIGRGSTASARPPGGDTFASTRPFRISYRIVQQGMSEESMLVSVAPPKQTLVRGSNRVILDTAAMTMCSGDREAMTCFAAEDGASLGQVGAFGIREDPATLREWASQKSTPTERIGPEVVAGRRALCKRTEVPGALSTALCYDREIGALLRAEYRSADQTILMIEAQSFGEPKEEDFALPANIQTIKP